MRSGRALSRQRWFAETGVAWACRCRGGRNSGKGAIFDRLHDLPGPARGALEAAIGAILECPKCQSMVQIVPPEGWVSPQAPVPGNGQPAAASPGGPPPLDRVAVGPLPLDLEPGDSSLLGQVFDQRWLLGVCVAAVVVVLCGLLYVLVHRPSDRPGAAKSKDVVFSLGASLRTRRRATR